jgi:hypothetical protein
MTLVVIRWRRKALDRDEWRGVLRRPRFEEGCSATGDDDDDDDDDLGRGK